MASLQDRSHEQLMRKQLLLLGVVFSSFVWLLFQIDTAIPSFLVPSDRIIDAGFQGQPAFLVNSPGCRIQYMDPYNEVVRPFITPVDPPRCNKYSTGRLVKADSDSLFIDLEVLHLLAGNYSVHPNKVKCYYSEFWRLEHPFKKKGIYPWHVDTLVKYSNNSIEIRNRTLVINEEFVKVHCKINNEQVYLDYFAFPRAKKGRRKEEKAAVSVLLIGVDAVSRLNLHRQMPRTVAFLKERVKAIEMLGYNKVGDNTFPNMVPALSGLSEEEITKTCWRKQNVFDDCPFVWKKYKEANFSTGYYEDAAWMGLFNYRKYGFRKQPTDFYSQVYSLEAEREVGLDKRLNAHLCLSNRMTVEVLLETAKRYVMKSEEILSWAIFWSSSLSHDFLNLPRYGDATFTKFMEELLYNGVFNSTVVVFMSDHGMRWGGIRKTYQGYIEERLPFLFIAYPEWFGDKYQLAIRNLRTNRRRLTTHFDLHETLVDLIDLKNLQDEAVKERTDDLRKESRRGVSLFLPILENRTCSAAGITDNWCTCYVTSPIPTTDPMVNKAALALIDHLNDLLADYPECSRLSLLKILSARLGEVNSTGEDKKNSLNTKLTDYIITIVAEPGNGLFEATLRYSSAIKDLNVINAVSRLNTYGDQSKCISHYLYKLYCFCK